MALSHLIHRRIPLKPTFLSLSHLFPPKPMSQNLCSIPQIDEQQQLPKNPPNPSSLSARMSFVFDQIDAIEKERSQKDETLQRIRAWRESKTKKYTNNDDNDDATNVIANVNVNPSGGSTSFGGDFGSAVSGKNGGGLMMMMMMRKGLEMVHPWPEWIELMERLVRQNYFDHRRKDEERMVEDLGFQIEEVVEEGRFYQGLEDCADCLS